MRSMQSWLSTNWTFLRPSPSLVYRSCSSCIKEENLRTIYRSPVWTYSMAEYAPSFINLTIKNRCNENTGADFAAYPAHPKTRFNSKKIQLFDKWISGWWYLVRCRMKKTNIQSASQQLSDEKPSNLKLNFWLKMRNYRILLWDLQIDYLQNSLVEELLQFLVAIIDAKLFEAVHGEVFEAGDVEHADVIFWLLSNNK